MKTITLNPSDLNMTGGANCDNVNKISMPFPLNLIKMKFTSTRRYIESTSKSFK